eukprot:762514-Hanusia_phi.AAC.15
MSEATEGSGEMSRARTLLPLTSSFFLLSLSSCSDEFFDSALWPWNRHSATSQDRFVVPISTRIKQRLRGGAFEDLSSDLSAHLVHIPASPDDSQEVMPPLFFAFLFGQTGTLNDRWEQRRQRMKEVYKEMQENEEAEEARRHVFEDKIKVSAPHVLYASRGGQEVVLSGNSEMLGLWHADKVRTAFSTVNISARLLRLVEGNFPAC